MRDEFPDIERGELADQPIPETLRFERRTVDRWPISGAATAVCIGGERFGRTYDLKLSDASSDGLGATCDMPLDPGTLVSVGFQGPAMNQGAGGFRQATVLRCRPCGAGYRVGLQFALRAAA